MRRWEMAQRFVSGFLRDTRMHVQAFVSRVVRMPASGVKSPIATSSVKRTRQLLQGRQLLERVEASNVYSLRPRSRKLLQFLSRVSVGCTTQERTGLGTGDRLGKQGAENTLVCCVRSLSPWTRMARLLAAGRPDTGSFWAPVPTKPVLRMCSAEWNCGHAEIGAGAL